MGKVAKINVDGTLAIVDIDFTQNSNKINKRIHELIGNNCRVYQTVPVCFLYEYLNIEPYPRNKEDVGLIMLVDEEAKLKNADINADATVLASKERYELIAGNCLIVGTRYVKIGDIEEVDFCEVPLGILKIITELLIKFKKDILEDIALKDDKSKKCITCIKLNKENGNTLPIICPQFQSLCHALQVKYYEMTPEELVEKLDNCIGSKYLEKAFNKCWDNGDMPNLFNEMKDMMDAAGDELVRVDMNNENVFNQELINTTIECWDILIKKGVNELYTFERQ